MSRLLDLVQQYKRVDLTDFVRVRAEGVTIGWTKRDMAQKLASLGNAWALQNDALVLKNDTSGFDAITAAVDADFHTAMKNGWIKQKPDYPHGDDWLGVGRNRGKDSLFIARRFFMAHLGAMIDCAFVNGYENGSIWMAIRGQGVDYAAGLYDLMVGGTRQYDQTTEQAAATEGEQEAGMTPQHTSQMKFVNAPQLYYINSSGCLKNEIFNVYDFDTKGEFVPHSDETWEIAGFEKIPFEQVLHMLENTPERIKSHIRIIMIDFLIRHGVIPKSYPGYDELVAAIHEKIDLYA